MKFFYLTDGSERSLTPFFAPSAVSLTLLCLWTILLGLLAAWPHESYHQYISGHKTPLSFWVVHTVVLVLIPYFSVRCGRGELSFPEERQIDIHKAEKTYEEEYGFFSYGLIAFVLHTAFLLLLLMPALVVSACLSGMFPGRLAVGLMVLFLTALLCRLFSFFIYILWEKKNLVGYYLTRIFYILIVFGLLAAPDYASPLRMIYLLHISPEFPSREATLFALIACAAVSILTIAISRRLPASARRKGEGEMRYD